MNDCTASKQNFDSSYIYKVEEREESENIFCHSNRGLVSIETNELPKVTRYFLKNNKGEPQGYIERKLIPNFNPAMTNDDEFYPQNCTIDKVMLQPAPHKENTKVKTASQATPKGERKISPFGNNSKRFHRSHELSTPLNSSAFERRRNYRLDCPSPNSTASERTFDIKQPASTADSVIRKNIKRQPMNEKSFAKLTSKVTAKKSQRLFCNDPNKRLKNLFTIIQSNEKSNEQIIENADIPDGHDLNLLSRTKDLLVRLIDEELHRVHPDDDTTKSGKLQRGNVIDRRALKKLKLDFIGKIEEELRLMKRLQI